MLQWVPALSTLGFACTEEFYGSLTGLDFLYNCWTANPGMLERNTLCEHLSERVMNQFTIRGFDADIPEACEPCTEACALASILQVLHVNVTTVHECTETFFYFLFGLSLLARSTSERGKMLMAHGDASALYDRRKTQCAELRRAEMKDWFVEFRDVHFAMQERKGELSNHSSASPNLKPNPHPRRAIIIAVANAENVLSTYQPMINLWRCYAVRHHYELLLDTDDTEIQAHFRSPNWVRWFSAQKYLPYYDGLLIVDPDEYVVPQCWDIDLVTGAPPQDRICGNDFCVFP